MNEQSEYNKLIMNARAYYESRPYELQKIRIDTDIFDFIWCEGLTDEINLWTYWQGAGIERPEVMIIGQDFGSCNDEENRDFYNKCVYSSIGDYENISAEYIDRITANKRNKTDNMLLDLTEKGLGYKYSARIPGNKSLFMTNLCLGYRSENKISGGNISAYLKHDSIYIMELIRIKRPKVVICLGMDTYFSMISAFMDDKKVLSGISTSFWKSLDEGKNYIDISHDVFRFRIYGVSHAGSNGAMNRKRNCLQKNSKETSGIELMLEDWKKIGNYLNK